MRKTTILFLCFANSFFAQTTIKTNLLTALVGIPQVGVETQIGRKSTLQLDVTASFWKSINNKPFQFVIVIPEYRYYFKNAFDGFYVGAHIGGSAFKVQKWNYKNSDFYQEGYSILYGGTTGYQYKLNNSFNVEFFAGVGSIQSFYKGYSLETGIRYDGAENFNISGEVLPYRLGAMLVYKLK